MASKRGLTSLFRGRNGGEDRWRRRARTREAELEAAEHPSELAKSSPRSTNGSGGPDGPVSNGLNGPNGSSTRPKLKKLRFALVILGLSILALISWVFGIMMAVASDLPQLEARAQFETAQNSVVKDRYGNKIATLTNNEGRILIPSDQIAPIMKESVVAIEDQRFYEHRGVDFQGIGRAIWADLTSGSAAQGASTITQQFVKNALAAENDRTVFQKLREAALAYQLERNWDKDKILTEYLNSIYFGEGAYGIEAAAHTYFGWNHPGCGEQGADTDTCASQLLPWEAAMLAGIISSPSAYSPRANHDAALERRNLVLQNMANQGYITQEEDADYAKQPLPRPSQIQTPEENSRAPYFTSWLRQQLVDKYGAGEAFGGGLNIESSLDLEFQNEVSGIVQSHVGYIEPTSAVVVLDNATSEVLAMVGGEDYDKSAFNLATQGHRQPGSSFKPFTLVTALSQGRSQYDTISSQPKQFPFTIKVAGKHGKDELVHDLFDVNNYDDVYGGSYTIRDGTTYSDNSVYAELGLNAGVSNVAKTAERMGIDSDLSTANEYRIDGGIGDGQFHPYNPALILGGLENGVTPLEMSHAYETLAEGGKRITGTLAASKDGPVAIRRVQADGDIVDTNDGTSGENKTEGHQVIDAGVAATAKSILETVVQSGTGRLANTGDLGEFGKTGTTEDNGDAWFCGATTRITACVWVGHADSNKPMETEYNGGPVDGGTIPALIWHDVVEAYDARLAAVKADARAKKAAQDSADGTTTTYAPTTTTYSTTPTTPTTPTPQTDTPPADEATPPADTGGGDSGGGGGTDSGGAVTGKRD
jgi:penicillin-binding protein 1A